MPNDKQRYGEGWSVTDTESDSRQPRSQPVGRTSLDESPKRGMLSRAVQHWVQHGFWPKEYFHDQGFYEEFEDTISHSLARRKLSFAPRRSAAGDTSTSIDPKLKVEEIISYHDPRYIDILEANRTFMYQPEHGITEAGKTLCNELLNDSQENPKGTLFDDDVFSRAIAKLLSRNESRVILDIHRLLVPSAEGFAIRGAQHLDILIENVAEGWNSSIPLSQSRPQPDYSVGFRLIAFSPEQQPKLKLLLGGLNSTSYFAATWRCFFPFLTCEVKCGAVSLEVADLQNMHSMTLAVRSVVELYRTVGREQELDRQILAFSISHSNTEYTSTVIMQSSMGKIHLTIDTRSINSISMRSKVETSGCRINSPRTSMMYGCRSTWNASVPPLTISRRTSTSTCLFSLLQRTSMSLPRRLKL